MQMLLLVQDDKSPFNLALYFVFWTPSFTLFHADLYDKANDNIVRLQNFSRITNQMDKMDSFNAPTK